MATASTPTQTRTNLTTLLGGAERASERARATVAAAGVPDTAGGATIAARFVTSLAGARDAYGHARVRVAALAVDEPKAFYDGVGAAMAALSAEYAASALDTTNINSPELRKAFDEVPECR